MASSLATPEKVSDDAQSLARICEFYARQANRGNLPTATQWARVTAMADSLARRIST